MFTRRSFLTLALYPALVACAPEQQVTRRRGIRRRTKKKNLDHLKKLTPQPAPPSSAIPPIGARLELTEDQWRERLTPRQFEILRDGGTEYAWTGRYLKNTKPGRYHCAACNNPLFSADHKYDSRTGWPSFTRPVRPERVVTRPDPRHGLERTEILCAHCDGHLGHVFDDGPAPDGLRFCVNSISLFFRPDS